MPSPSDGSPFMTNPRKLLVLYTGGTIGMQPGADGLAPASGFEQRLRDEQAAQGIVLPDWQFLALEPPLDSANMSQANWLAMRDAIVAAAADGCDGVLLLHGTDSLAYSAAALSFLLLGLPLPVVLTGSMQPAGLPGSDGWPNLFGAFQQLADGLQDGVWLYFAGRLLHGANASKLTSSAFDAFAASQRPRQGERAPAIPALLGWRQPRSAVNLAVLPVFPGLRAEHVQALLDSGVQGLLLECYGSGTGPSDNQQLLDTLSAAHARGVVLAAISQCPQGAVEFGVYAAGSRLAASGLISGHGMSREAALAKLFSLMGAGLAQSEIEHWFGLDLCGEMLGA